MSSFLPHLISVIGFTIAFLGVGYGAISLIDALNEAAKDRRERLQRLITALERMEANTRSNRTPQA